MPAGIRAAPGRRRAGVLMPVERSPPVLLLALAVRVDVLDRFLDAGDLFRILVGDFDAELLFERHHEFDRVEGVGTQVVDERRIRRDLFLIHPELLHDDALDLFRYRHSLLLRASPAWAPAWAYM